MREAKKSLAFRPRARPVAVSRPAQTHTKTQRQTRSASVWLSRALQREKEIARPIPQGLRPTPTHIAGLLAETDPWSRATAAPALLCPKPLQRPLPLPNPNPYPGRAHARPFYGSTLRQRHDPLPVLSLRTLQNAPPKGRPPWAPSTPSERCRLRAPRRIVRDSRDRLWSGRRSQSTLDVEHRSPRVRTPAGDALRVDNQAVPLEKTEMLR